MGGARGAKRVVADAGAGRRGGGRPTGKASRLTGARRREPGIIAGVDLGSNSFHMVVARVVRGRLHVIDRMREVVRLAAGLDEQRQLRPEARARALACLKRFGQRLRGMPASSVLVVGTNTFRQARKTKPFLLQAERAIGHDIEVLPGREEARLIYLGVAHDLPDAGGRRLVVDIGGGSTECIVGEGFDPLEADSLYMGCVAWSMKYFPEGRIREKAMREAQIAAALELQPIRRRYRELGWKECIGSSGTALHIESILRSNGFSTDGITWKGLERLRRELVSAGRLDGLRLRGLEPDRLAVLPGGLAILCAIFEGLQVKRMRVSNGALREGLLYELVGRFRHEDVRDQTILRLAEQHHVDTEQSERVEQAALRLLAQLEEGEIDPEAEATRVALGWAARLHEIGLSIAYAGYHKHSAYLVTHADMPGFSRDDQQELAAVILGHRRRLPTATFDELPADRRDRALRLCLVLRLAVCLNRSRSHARPPVPRLEVHGRRWDLFFDPRWLEQHPLTKADLLEEAARLEEAGFELRIR